MLHTTLMIDSSFPTVQVGLLQEEQFTFYHREKPALEAIFEGVDYCLNEATISFDTIERFVFCEGPGSMLGIRLAAMAIRAWQSPLATHQTPLYTYYSLCAQAALLIASGNVLPFHLIAYFRAGQWSHLYVTDKDKLGVPGCITSEAVECLKGKCFWLSSGKQTQSPPIFTDKIDYNLKGCSTILDYPGLLRFKEKPEVFSPLETSYAQWEGQRHRAPK